MSLTRYYKRTLMIPFLFLLCAFIAYQIYEANTYKSEWLTWDAFLPIECVMLLIHYAIVACLCLPILMNKRPDVSEVRLRSFLSWFLCPMLYLGWVLYRSARENDETAERLLVLSATVPLFCSLTVTYIQFRRSLKAKNR